jgi:hypothetical protein
VIRNYAAKRVNQRKLASQTHDQTEMDLQTAKKAVLSQSETFFPSGVMQDLSHEIFLRSKWIGWLL